jgi:hypothetical protein
VCFGLLVEVIEVGVQIFAKLLVKVLAEKMCCRG